MQGRNAPINPDNLIKVKKYSVGQILDLGCGEIDLADTTVDVDERVEPDVGHDLDEFPYPFDENEYDTVWLIHVLEHLEEPNKALREAKRIAKKRVIVIIPIGERNDPSHKRIYVPEDLDEFDYDRLERSEMGGFIDAVLVWEQINNE